MCFGLKDHSDCWEHKVQKLASVMVYGCVGVHVIGNLHHKSLNVHAGFETVYAAVQASFRVHPCSFLWDNAEQLTATF